MPIVGDEQISHIISYHELYDIHIVQISSAHDMPTSQTEDQNSEHNCTGVAFCWRDVLLSKDI